jgi:hypothetical protein
MTTGKVWETSQPNFFCFGFLLCNQCNLSHYFISKIIIIIAITTIITTTIILRRLQRFVVKLKMLTPRVLRFV